jgi:hypothetical protein
LNPCKGSLPKTEPRATALDRATVHVEAVNDVTELHKAAQNTEVAYHERSGGPSRH